VRIKVFRVLLPQLIAKLHLASRIALGAVFLSSGILKMISSDRATEFLSQVSSLDMSISRVLIVALCFFELLIGAMLLVGRKYLPLGSFLSSVVLLVFTFVGVSAFESPRSCGCFGDILDLKTDEYFVMRNIVLLLISMFILKFSTGAVSTYKNQ